MDLPKNDQTTAKPKFSNEMFLSILQDNHPSTLGIPMSGIRPLTTPSLMYDSDVAQTPESVFTCPSVPPARMVRTRPRVARNMMGGGVSLSPLTPR